MRVKVTAPLLIYFGCKKHATPKHSIRCFNPIIPSILLSLKSLWLKLKVILRNLIFHLLNPTLMVLEGDAQKLKVIIGESDRVYQRPLFEAIVFAAKKYKMAGVTATKGLISYGADSIVNNSKVFSLSPELPVIIELVDRVERIRNFSEIASKLLEKSGSGGIIFIEDVNVVIYKSNSK